MGDWIADIQGVTTVVNKVGTPLQRRNAIKFTGITVDDDGTQTVVHLGPVVVAGAPSPTTTELYNQLKALGFFV